MVLSRAWPDAQHVVAHQDFAADAQLLKLLIVSLLHRCVAFVKSAVFGGPCVRRRQWRGDQSMDELAYLLEHLDINK